MKLIVLGPQGSGKGTQAELLANHFRIPHIDAGRMLRDESSKNTIRGKKIKARIEKGELIHDEIMLYLLKNRLKKQDCRKGFVLDGFPRTLNQAKQFHVQNSLDKVVFLHISDSIAVKRLSQRLQCENCGTIYGVEIKPKKNRVCDKCGGLLFQRIDDTPRVIKKRLMIYHKQVKPIIDFYTAKRLLVDFDGSKDVAFIFKKILYSLRK